MTELYNDNCKTSFRSADDMVAHLAGQEELVAVCPGMVMIDPPPTNTSEKSIEQPKSKKTNPIVYVIILALLVLLAFSIPKLLHHGIELLLLIIIFPVLVIVWLVWLRVGQNAVIVTDHHVWAIYGMIHDRKQNLYFFNSACKAPRKEVTLSSSSGTLRRLEFKMSDKYTVKVQQGPLTKTKYYSNKTVDTHELKELLS